MKVGAEPKRLAILGGLILAGGYFFYANVLSDSTPAPSQAQRASRPASAAAVDAVAGTPPTAAPLGVRRAPTRSSGTQEFRPSLKPRRAEDRPDPMTIDPTLRLDLLAKVQAVELTGGARNLFQFSTPPPPPLHKTPEAKIIPKTPAEVAKEQAEAQAKAGPPAPPPPPPINLKYYGYSSVRADGRKRAFFLDGDDILVAGEGETVKRRYRVVRIGVNSVVMEDTESKSQQTLPMQEEAAAG